MDPLLNIHLHHNLAEILPLTTDFINEFHSDCECLETAECKVDEMLDEACQEPALKKMKLCKEKSSHMSGETESSILVSFEFQKINHVVPNIDFVSK